MQIAKLHKFSKKKYFIGIIIILIIGLLLRIYRLDYQDVWRDEAFSINVASLSIYDMLNAIINDTQAPLHIILLHFWINLFGDSAFSVRFISVLFGMMIPIYSFFISRIIFKDILFHIATILLTSTSPILIYYSQETRSYSMFGAFSIICFYYFLRFIRDDKSKLPILFIVISILGLYTHNLFWIVIISIYTSYIIYSLTQNQKNNSNQILTSAKSKKLLICISIILFLYLPWGVIFWRQVNNTLGQDFWLEFHPLESFLSIFHHFFITHKFNSSQLNIFEIIVKFTTLISGSVLVTLGIIKNKLNNLTIFTLTSLFMIYIISFITPLFFIRYLTFLSPFILMIALLGIRSIINQYRLIIIFTILFSIASTFISLTNISNHYNKSQYTEAIRLIEENYLNESTIILHTEVNTFHSFNYYSDLENFVYDPFRNIEYFQGTSYLQDEKYLNENLSQFDTLIIFNITDLEDTTIRTSSLGFIKKSTIKFEPELYLSLWENSNGKSSEFDLR